MTRRSPPSSSPSSRASSSTSTRMTAFKLVVLSLFSTTAQHYSVTAFVQSSSLRQSVQQQQLPTSAVPKSTRPPSTIISSSVVNNKEEILSKDARQLKTPTLSREEETDLLRQVFEYRRISKLEKDLALSPKYHGSPLLVSVKAREAGYGDELDLYEQAKFDGQKAREELVTRNMGLVHYCVNQIIGKDINGGGKKNGSSPRALYKKLPLNSLSREDLVQEGAIGLARAVDKWNPAIAVDGSTKGNKFSTYAYYWIRAAVLRCIAERDDLMRVPSHVSQAVREINKAASRLGIDLEGGGSGTVSSLSWKEAHAAKKLAEEAGLTDKKFAEAMKVRSRRYSGGYVPFEQWMQKGQNIESDVADMTAMSISSSMSATATMAASDNAEQVRSVLSKYLRPKEIEALSWRYGLLKDDIQAQAAVNESPIDRANRQFAEMEDQLFGATTSPTTTSVLAAVSTTTDAVAADTLKRKSADAVAQHEQHLKQQQQRRKAVIPTGPTGKSGEAMSFVDVGKRMEVSAEYTRKLCHRALNKLRSAADEGRLEPAFLM